MCALSVNCLSCMKQNIETVAHRVRDENLRTTLRNFIRLWMTKKLTVISKVKILL